MNTKYWVIAAYKWLWDGGEDIRGIREDTVGMIPRGFISLREERENNYKIVMNREHATKFYTEGEAYEFMNSLLFKGPLEVMEIKRDDRF